MCIAHVLFHLQVCCGYWALSVNAVLCMCVQTTSESEYPKLTSYSQFAWDFLDFRNKNKK